MEVKRFSSFVRKSFGATRDEKTGAAIGYYSDDDSCDGEEENKSLAAEAEAAEEMLGEALSIASARTGSLLSLQSAPRTKAVELGRQASVLSIQDCEDAEDGGSIRSFRSARSVRSADPVFIKAPKGDPIMLTQKSWDAIVEMEKDRAKGQLRLKSVMTDEELASLKARKWDKLRKDLKNQDGQKKGNRFTRGLKKTFGVFKRKKIEHVSSVAEVPKRQLDSPTCESSCLPRESDSPEPSKPSDSTASVHSEASAASSKHSETALEEREEPVQTQGRGVPIDLPTIDPPVGIVGHEVSLNDINPVAAWGLDADVEIEEPNGVYPAGKEDSADSLNGTDATEASYGSDDEFESYLISVENHKIIVETRRAQDPDAGILPPKTIEEEESMEILYSGFCSSSGCGSAPCGILTPFGVRA